MSAPHTDLEKQKKRHKGPLAGMRAVVLGALALLALLAIYVVVTGNEPEQPDQLIDGRTGDVEVTE